MYHLLSCKSWTKTQEYQDDILNKKQETLLFDLSNSQISQWALTFYDSHPNLYTPATCWSSKAGQRTHWIHLIFNRGLWAWKFRIPVTKTFQKVWYVHFAGSCRTYNNRIQHWRKRIVYELVLIMICVRSCPDHDPLFCKMNGEKCMISLRSEILVPQCSTVNCNCS